VSDEPTEESPAKPPQPSSGLLGYLVLAAALVLAIGVGAYLFVSGGDDDGVTPSSDGVTTRTPDPNTGPLEPNRPKEGERAPDFALVDARDPSRLVKLSDFRGKAVIVNWYASWCGPCKNEIPAFVKAQQALDGQLVVLGVDFLESSDKATGILDEFDATYPAVLDSAGAVAEHYRTSSGVPYSFFIDKDGILRAIRRGEVFEKDLGEYLAKVGLEYAP
jgi:thiol-disulfide isomerase/thioredoxin